MTLQEAVLRNIHAPDLAPLGDSGIKGLGEFASFNHGSAWFNALIADRPFGDKTREVGRVIASSPRRAAFAPASEIARAAGANSATVVRFAQSLGFEGWPDFQLNFRHRYFGSLLPSQVLHQQHNRDDSSPFHASLHNDIHNLQVTLQSIDLALLSSVADAIVDAKQSICVSSGSYVTPAIPLVHLSRFLGYRISLETRGGADLVATLATLTSDDCLLAFAFWRVGKDIANALRHAHQVGARTVLITDSTFSPLTEWADLVVVVPSEGSSFFQSTTAALSLVYGMVDELHSRASAQRPDLVRDTEKMYAELDTLFY